LLNGRRHGNYHYLRCDVVIYALVYLQRKTQLIIDDVAVNIVDKVRDLGIIINTKLTFLEHINLMVAEAHRRANQILRFFS